MFNYELLLRFSVRKRLFKVHGSFLGRKEIRIRNGGKLGKEEKEEDKRREGMKAEKKKGRKEGTSKLRKS